jgi:Ca2+-binding EF-hand superfamily protein
MADLAERVRRRGGPWGVRGFRVALAAAAPDGVVVNSMEVGRALQRFGIRSVSRNQIVRTFPFNADTATIDDVMSAIYVGISASTYEDVVETFDLVAERLVEGSGSAAIPLRVLCASVRVDKIDHVDVAKLPLREALFTFFASWGVDSLDRTVGRDLWIQYHADWRVGFSDDKAFRAHLERVWDVTLSRPEAQGLSRAQLEKVFDDIDGNKNGRLSLAELDLACIRLWPQWNEKAAIRRAYKLADTKRDGLLTKNEFVNFAKYLPRYVTLLRKMREADTNGDRYLTVDELIKGKRLFGLHKWSDERLRAAFAMVDRDGSGKLGLEELCMFIAQSEGDTLMSRSTNEFVRRLSH